MSDFKKELFRSSAVSAQNWWACFVDNSPRDIRDQIGMGEFDPKKHKGGFFYRPLVCWSVDAYIGGEGCRGDAIHIVQGHVAGGSQVDTASSASNFLCYVYSAQDLSGMTEFYT